jgi:hypothetical protein
MHDTGNFYTVHESSSISPYITILLKEIEPESYEKCVISQYKSCTYHHYSLSDTLTLLLDSGRNCNTQSIYSNSFAFIEFICSIYCCFSRKVSCSGLFNFLIPFVTGFLWAENLTVISVEITAENKNNSFKINIILISCTLCGSVGHAFG